MVGCDWVCVSWLIDKANRFCTSLSAIVVSFFSTNDLAEPQDLLAIEFPFNTLPHLILTAFLQNCVITLRCFLLEKLLFI